MHRSGLETEVEKQIKKSKNVSHFAYEPKEGKLPYVIPSSNHLYTPDFYVTLSNGYTFIIEVKGIWDYEDRVKHALIKQQHPELDIRFVFSNAKKKIRKGSKTTYADICEGRGRGILKDRTWLYATKKIPKGWLEI